MYLYRLLKKLRKKNKNQIEIERKEQGFSLYVNGPHANPHANPTGAKGNIPTQPKTARKPKTAGGEHTLLGSKTCLKGPLDLGMWSLPIVS